MAGWGWFWGCLGQADFSLPLLCAHSAESWEGEFGEPQVEDNTGALAESQKKLTQ